MPALDGLADHRRRDLVGDLDVPHFAFVLRGEVGEQLRGYRYIAYLVAAQVEAARDFFERGPAKKRYIRLARRRKGASSFFQESAPDAVRRLGRAVEPSGTVVAIPFLCGLHHRYARI